MRKVELEERLIEFASQVIMFTKSIENFFAGNHLSGQIIHSSTLPALNYDEAQSAESKKDFIHKMGICLKELRETYNCIRIIERASLSKEINKTNDLKKEVNELISILVASIKTAKSNSEIKNR